MQLGGLDKFWVITINGAGISDSVEINKLFIVRSIFIMAGADQHNMWIVVVQSIMAVRHAVAVYYPLKSICISHSLTCFDRGCVCVSVSHTKTAAERK